MPGEVRAVIDVGTNSVKLLVAEVEGRVVRPLFEGSNQTRLGQGFYETHVLQPGAIDQTAKSVAEFVQEAQAWSPVSLKIFATSAARDATNKELLLSTIETVSGVPVEIITGEQEADWAYQGVTSDPQLAARSLLVVDVGGGSTEFIVGKEGVRQFTESFPIGSVRLLERVPLSDPPTERERERCRNEIRHVIETSIKPHVASILRTSSAPVQLVGTGGTSTILARVELKLRSFNRELIEGTLLSRERLRNETLRLWSMPLEKRRHIIGLPQNRADVILPGALIFEEVMQALELDSLRVSTRGLRFAAVRA